MEKASTSITLQSIIKKRVMPSTHAYSARHVDKSISYAKVEGFVEVGYLLSKWSMFWKHWLLSFNISPWYSVEGFVIIGYLHSFEECRMQWQCWWCQSCMSTWDSEADRKMECMPLSFFKLGCLNVEHMDAVLVKTLFYFISH